MDALFILVSTSGHQALEDVSQHAFHQEAAWTLHRWPYKSRLPWGRGEVVVSDNAVDASIIMGSIDWFLYSH